MKKGNILEYKGYFGSAEVSVEDGCLCGALLAIPDVVAYSADTYPELESHFHEAVDGYIAFCREQGRKPAKPSDGSSTAAFLAAALLAAESNRENLKAAVFQITRGKAASKTRVRRAVVATANRI